MINIFVLVTILGHLPVILSAKRKGSDNMKQILIVEDDNLLNKTLTYNLELDGYTITSVLNARTAAESLKTNIFDLVLLDINLPDGNGIVACKTLLEKHQNLRIIALTNFEDSIFIKQILKNGAMGYLLKNTSKNELTQAIIDVNNGKRYLPKNINDILLNDSIGIENSNSFIPKLTIREKEILTLIVQEFITEEIAGKLFISKKTVESHRSNLIQKLGVKNVAGLVRVAIEKGIL